MKTMDMTTALNEKRVRGRRLAVALVAGAAAIGLAVAGPQSASAAGQTATTPVPGVGQTTTTLTWPDDLGVDVNVVLYANWSAVSAGSATLDSIRVCAGQTVGGESLYILPTIYSGDAEAVSLGNKFVPTQQCNTWTVGQTLPVYASGQTYGQVQLNWYAGSGGAANVYSQYDVG
jgi:hypothetical protein